MADHRDDPLSRLRPRVPVALRPLLDTIERSLARFVELEGFDRSMALAGQAFAALLPLLIVVGALYPSGSRDLADTLIERFDLTGSTASTVEATVAQAPEIEDSLSVFSVLLLILSGLSFTRAMQRLYTRAWRLDKPGLRGNVWGLAWLACFAMYWSLQPLVVGAFDDALAVAVSLALSCGLWLFTPWLLVGRQISRRRLLPQAVLTAVGLTALGLGAVLYAPAAISSAAAQFGFIGVAFFMLSFLFAVSFVLVVAASLGAVLAEPRAAR